MQAVGRAKARAFGRAGAFVWTRARRSIRKRKRSADPGQPPSSHEGSLRRLYFFSWDRATESVVIGPAKFRKGNVPELLEHGGTVPANGRVIYQRRKPGRNSKGQFVTAGVDKITLAGNLVYRGNPSAGPALRAEAPRIAMQFRDSLR